MLLSCSGDHAGLPGLQPVYAVFLSVGDGERKARSGGEKWGKNRGINGNRKRKMGRHVMRRPLAVLRFWCIIVGLVVF